MKKLFALFLISIMLLSSCADIDKSGAGGGDAPFDVLVITSFYPVNALDYKSGDPLANLDYICRYWNVYDYDYDKFFSYKPNAKFFLGTTAMKTAPDFCGIFDSEKKFKSFYEHLNLGNYTPYPDDQFLEEKYEDHFSEGFFDDCFILYIAYLGSTFHWPFVNVDYTFESNEKNLNVTFTTRPHEGWRASAADSVKTTMYIVPIAKKDIKVDGKLVPYEELNIEVNYMLTFE